MMTEIKGLTDSGLGYLAFNDKDGAGISEEQ